MAPGSSSVVIAYIEDVLNGQRPDEAHEVIANDALAQRSAAIRRAFPDLRVVVREIVADRELVAVHLSGQGTHRGIFQGVPATNRSWSASCTALYRVRNGRIVDFWVNWDDLAILEQLGGVARLAPASA